jgi:hypothetical protein
VFSKKRQLRSERRFGERKEPTLPEGPLAAPGPGDIKDRPSALPSSLPVTGVSVETDIVSIGEGIAGLLAEEALDRSSPNPASPSEALPNTNGGGARFLSEPSAYAVPHDYGEPADESMPPPAASPIPKVQDNGSALQRRLITQIAETMWFPSGTSEAAREERVLEAFEALQGIDPQDEVEGMLACQLVVTHRAALDCLQLSMASTTRPADRGAIIDQVDKLVTIYGRNLAALDKHRSLDHGLSPNRADGAKSAIAETLLRLKTKDADRQRAH